MTDKCRKLLLQLMNKYYGKQAILLLDEYDVPLAKASSHGYYDEMLSILKIMMSTAFKDNSDLLFAVITGCLKIAKESIFTGTNNFVSDTISSSRLNEFFGFTQSEVNQILKDADCIRHASEVKQWYDGCLLSMGCDELFAGFAAESDDTSVQLLEKYK